MNILRAALPFSVAVAGCAHFPPDVHPLNVELLIPSHVVAPNPTDRSFPGLELIVYFDGTRHDTVIKPAGTYYFSAYPRCIYVESPFRIVLIGTDPESGVSHMNVGSPDLPPLPASARATPLPDSPTQATDPIFFSGTYPNPGSWPGSHDAEVTYFTGSTPPGRVYDRATLSATFEFAGAKSAEIGAAVENTSVWAMVSSLGGYYVMPAGKMHPPGTACTPPPQ